MVIVKFAERAACVATNLFDFKLTRGNKFYLVAAKLPALLHLAADSLGGHVPQGNEQREWLREEHNRELELRGDKYPIEYVGENIVACGVAGVACVAWAGVRDVLQVSGDSVQRRVHGAEKKSDENNNGGAYNLSLQMLPSGHSGSHCVGVGCRYHGRDVADTSSAGGTGSDKRGNDKKEHGNLAGRLHE